MSLYRISRPQRVKVGIFYILYQSIFQTTPTVVGYNPGAYGTQGQTMAPGHYPQGQPMPQGYPQGQPMPQGYPQGQPVPQGYPQGQPAPQGYYPQGPPGGPQGYSQAVPPDDPKDLPPSYNEAINEWYGEI